MIGEKKNLILSKPTANNNLQQRAGSRGLPSLTLRIGSPSDTLTAIALAPSGRTKQSPKFITWMLRKCFKACEDTDSICCIRLKITSTNDGDAYFHYIQIILSYFAGTVQMYLVKA